MIDDYPALQNFIKAYDPSLIIPVNSFVAFHTIQKDIIGVLIQQPNNTLTWQLAKGQTTISQDVPAIINQADAIEITLQALNTLVQKSKNSGMIEF